jgi:hypothetical protein
LTYVFDAMRLSVILLTNGAYMAFKLPLFVLSALLLIGVFAYPSYAQDAPPTPQTLALKATQIDVTRPPAPGQSHAPIPITRHFANPALLAQAKANLAAARKSSPTANGGHGKPTPTPSPSPTPTGSPAPISQGVGSPVTFTSFDAMNLFDGGGYVPPDTIVAAGASTAGTLVFEAVNSLSTVYDTTGASVAILNTTACTTNTSTDSVSDPRVLFDSGRWFVSTTTFSPIGDASWNLLFSTGSDPNLSNWYCLIIPTSSIRNPDGTTGNFPDFPKIGINSDKVVLTGDAFSQNRRGYKFQGTEFVVINKSDLLSLSSTVRTSLFAPNQGDFAIEPGDQINSTADPLYMAAVNSALASTSSLDVWTIAGVPGDSSNPLQTPKVSRLPIDTISYPPNALQQGTTALIDTNDDSLLDAFREDSGSLWVSANDACTPKGDTAVRSCARFINVSIGSGGSLSVAQDFDYADLGTDYYYPAVRTDTYGNLYAAFSGSSGTSYPSAYAGMQSFGNTNELTKLSLTRAGDAAYTVSPPRWGDYSGASVDPTGSSVWLGAEYATGLPPVLPSYWGTAIAHVSP